MSQTILHIEARVAELQRSKVGLEEQLKNEQNNSENNINDAALRIIDLLDMITAVDSNMGVGGEINAQFVIKKIEKRLLELLRRWGVQEITFKDGRIEADKTRVLETREVVGDVPVSAIIEVCRKGYQRNDQTIRPVDVITASNSS